MPACTQLLRNAVLDEHAPVHGNSAELQRPLNLEVLVGVGEGVAHEQACVAHVALQPALVFGEAETHIGVGAQPADVDHM